MNKSIQYNVLFTSVSQTGKTTAINNYVSNKGEAGCLENNSAMTNRIMKYDYGNIKLIDTIGTYDAYNNDYTKSWHLIRTQLQTVNDVDYVVLCIQATKHGIRDIDITNKKVLDSFIHLNRRVIVYITKTDFLDQQQFNNFIIAYINHGSFNDCFTFTGPNNHRMDVKSPILYSLSEDKDLIFSVMNSKSDRTQKNYIDDNINIPHINHVQKYMIENNLYPDQYIKYDIGSWFFEKWNNLRLYKFNYYSEPCYEIRLRKIDQTSTDDAIVNCVIEYASGKIFFDGRMYGSRFHIGTFYYEDGSIMYKKEA